MVAIVKVEFVFMIRPRSLIDVVMTWLALPIEFNYFD